ncbi:hypothetical protein C0J52_03593 [Blattella germanica]|nr:hypothetical protein C0J52_03593 [Blattella germanica]
MEADNHGQRWTVWFIWREGVTASDFHKRLVSICGEEAPSCRSVFRWVSEFKDGMDHAKKRKSTGRSANAHKPHNTQLVNGWIWLLVTVPFSTR